jgi:hypothetical protein
LARRLARAAAHAPGPLREYAGVSGWPDGRVRALAESALREQGALRFFDTIPVGKRLVLVGKRTGREIFRFLADPDSQARFERALGQMPDVGVPGGIRSFRAFLRQFPAYETELEAFAAAWIRALAALAGASRELTDGVPADAWLPAATPAQLREWGDLVRGRGFALEHGQLVLIQQQLRLDNLRHRVVRRLGTPECRQQWRRTFKGRKRLSTEEKLLRLQDPRAQALLTDFAPADLARLAASVRAEKRLSSFAGKLAGKADVGAEQRGLSGRQVFLLLISFVVCMVGIANAMLMSITERFREIATMKCLGATDRYILIQFMLEAALQGVAGGFMGMLIGFAIALVKNTGSFGSAIFRSWAGGELALCAGLSLAAGVVLAVLASIYPSLAASRMAPMDAMRVE